MKKTPDKNIYKNILIILNFVSKEPLRRHPCELPFCPPVMPLQRRCAAFRRIECLENTQRETHKLRYIPVISRCCSYLSIAPTYFQSSYWNFYSSQNLVLNFDWGLKIGWQGLQKSDAMLEMCHWRHCCWAPWYRIQWSIAPRSWDA